MIKNVTTLYLTQVTALAAGTVFAWFSVFKEVSAFYAVYGTLFRFTDCTPPNPLLQACFYGAFVFLIGLVWATRIYQGVVVDRLKSQLHLTYLLIVGTLFGWGNVAFMLYADSQQITNTFTCSLSENANPFTSACFIGSVLFTLSLIAAIITYRHLKSATE